MEFFAKIAKMHNYFSKALYLRSRRVTLAYSEPCHIQKRVIFRTKDVFRTLSRYTLENPTIFRTFPYSEVWLAY